MENKRVKDMTKGNPAKLLLQFTIPLLIGNVFQQLYNMVDSIVVGNFVGENALGAIGTTNSLQFFFFSLVLGLSIGIGIVVSQYFGSSDEENVKNTIGNAIWAISICSVLMSLVGFFLARPALVLMNTDPAILEDAVIYLKVTAIGFICVGMYNGVSSILRALGDTKTPLTFLIVASLINVALDLLFVLQFKWGVVGVAVATAFAQLISAVACIIYAVKCTTFFRLTKENLKIKKAILYKCLQLGIPVALQNALIAVSLIVLQGVVNGFGATFTTAFTVVARIEQLVQQPFMSLGSAISTFTGQNMGAGNVKRVKQGFFSGTIISTVFVLAVLPIFWGFAPQIISIFGKSPDVIAIGTVGLRIDSCFLAFLGLIYTTRNVLNGAGDAMFSLMTGIVEMCGRIFLARPLTMVPMFGRYGVFFATGLTWFLNGTISLVRYKRGKWKKLNVISKISEN